MRKSGWIVVLLGWSVALGCSKSADKASGGAVEEAAGSGSAHHRKHDDRREPVIADAPRLSLDVVMGGKTVTWRQESFDKTPRYAKGTDGEARDVWSLRELVHQLAGPDARVTKVSGVDEAQAVDRAAWDNAARTPLLHTTRRGTLKFRWADADGRWGDDAVRDVVRIELAP